MLSRRLAAARLGRGGRASGSSRRRSGGRCCGGAAGPAWRRRSSGRRRSTLASALEQPSARSTLRLPQRTRTRRPPARDRPQPRSCIRGKQQSRCRYRVPCNPKAGAFAARASPRVMAWRRPPLSLVDEPGGRPGRLGFEASAVGESATGGFWALNRDELLAAMAAEAEAVAAHADRLDALGLESAREARDLAARWQRLVQELRPTPGRPSANSEARSVARRGERRPPAR
jgi:hypothetical protein